MVVISVKHSDGDGFLFETTTSTSNDDLITSLTNIHNDRLRVNILAQNLVELGKHGPSKKPEDQGLDDIQEKHAGAKIVKNEYYAADPLGVRTGNGPGPQLAETLNKTAQEAMEYVDKKQVQARVALDEKTLSDKIANMRGAVMMAYPMGLPDFDTIKIVLDSVAGLDGTGAAAQVLDVESTSLWVAGKEFMRGQLVSDRLGKNEKTKVIAKLQKTGGGPPQREPAVSEEERKAMMAHYFKKQEEQKKMADASEDEYLNSSWADTNNMKRNLQGLGNVRAPGM